MNTTAAWIYTKEDCHLQRMKMVSNLCNNVVEDLSGIARIRNDVDNMMITLIRQFKSVWIEVTEEQ